MSGRLTVEGSRVHQSHNHSTLLKECTFAQHTCVTCLSVSTSNACLHFPFQHKHIPILLTGGFPQYRTTPRIPSDWCVQSPSQCNNVSIQAITGCYHADSPWNYESAFPLDRYDVFLPKQRQRLPPWQQHQVLSGVLQLTDPHDWLIIYYSSSFLANHRDMEVLFYHAVPVFEACVRLTKPTEESKGFSLHKILVLFTAPRTLQLSAHSRLVIESS